MKFATRLLLAAYGSLWGLSRPLLRRHKRLKTNFAQRLVPATWALPQPCAVAADCFAHASAPMHSAPAVTSPIVWVQAASGGEAWLVEGLVNELQAQLAHHSAPFASITLFCTTWTEQGHQVLTHLAGQTAESPVQVVARYFPLDSPAIMHRAMQSLQPQLLVLLETELWPHLLLAARNHKVPVLVVNGRMTEKSLSGYSVIADFWANVAPQHTLAISFEDAARFASLFGATNVSVMPNIKFDRAMASLQQQDAVHHSYTHGKDHTQHDAFASYVSSAQANVHHHESSVHHGASHPHAPQAHPHGATAHHAVGQVLFASCACRNLPPLVLLASVRQEEEQLLLPHMASLVALQHKEHPATVIIAPRHMHRVHAWQTALHQLGVPCQLRSTLIEDIFTADITSSHAGKVIIWDAFGELDALYSYADVAFVGGSFAPLGGQNFLEPLGKGVCPAIGPHWKNFHWVGNELLEQQLVTQLATPEQLIPFVQQQFALALQGEPSHWAETRAKHRSTVQHQFGLWLQQRTGGSKQAASAILNALRQQ